MIVCKKCEHDNPDPARFCEKCGEFRQREGGDLVMRGRTVLVQRTISPKREATRRFHRVKGGRVAQW